MEMKFDPGTLERLRNLDQALQRAVAAEDFGEAKKLDMAIQNLKKIGVQLQKLEERKKIAVRNRDYESADILKKVSFFIKQCSNLFLRKLTL